MLILVALSGKMSLILPLFYYILCNFGTVIWHFVFDIAQQVPNTSKTSLTGTADGPKRRGFRAVVVDVTHSKPVRLVCLGDLHAPDDAGLQRRVRGHVRAKLQVRMRRKCAKTQLGPRRLFLLGLSSAPAVSLRKSASRLTPTSKNKAVEFHLTGESVLPHVSVLCPTVKDSAGSPVMHFRRVYVGNRHTLPLVLLNNGYFPVQVSSKEISSFISLTVLYSLHSRTFICSAQK